MLEKMSVNANIGDCMQWQVQNRIRLDFGQSAVIIAVHYYLTM